MKLLFAIGLSYIASLAQSGAIPNVIETKTNIVTRLTQRNQCKCLVMYILQPFVKVVFVHSVDIHCTDIVGCCPVIQNCTDNVLKILPNRKVRAVVAASRGCVNKIPCGCSSRGDMCTEDDKGYQSVPNQLVLFLVITIMCN